MIEDDIVTSGETTVETVDWIKACASCSEVLPFWPHTNSLKPGLMDWDEMVVRRVIKMEMLHKQVYLSSVKE